MRIAIPLAFLALLSCLKKDPTTAAIDALSGRERVYVPIEAGSLLSLTQAFEEKEYGEVTVDDFKRQFVYADLPFGPALVAYSTEDGVPESALIEPMSVTQWLRAALDDPTASGVVLDPNGGSAIALGKSDLSRALAELPAQPDAPMRLQR
jgi:hypothetical protein